MLLQGHELLGRINSADAVGVTKLVEKHLKPPGLQPNSTGLAQQTEETQEELEARLRGIMNQSPVVLFMKGSPDSPRCGFSKKAVALLREQNVEFTHFDILEDETVRQGDDATGPSFLYVSVHSFHDDRVEAVE